MGITLQLHRSRIGSFTTKEVQGKSQPTTEVQKCGPRILTFLALLVMLSALTSVQLSLKSNPDHHTKLINKAVIFQVDPVRRFSTQTFQ